MVYWNWERSKALSMVSVAPDKQANGQDKSLVTQVLISLVMAPPPPPPHTYEPT